MKMLVAAAISFFALVGPLTAYAKPGDHLEPVASPPGYAWDDSAIVAVVFKEAFEPNVLVRMYATSAFMYPTEDMVLLKKVKSSYRVIHLHTDIQLVSYTPGARVHGGPARSWPRDYHLIRPARCEVSLPAPLAENIVRVWHEALLMTRYDREPRWGLDGAYAQFSMLDGRQWLAGRTWSPEGGTVPHDLWAVAGSMQDYCEKRDTNVLARLNRETTALLERLKSGH